MESFSAGLCQLARSFYQPTVVLFHSNTIFNDSHLHLFGAISNTKRHFQHCAPVTAALCTWSSQRVLQVLSYFEYILVPPNKGDENGEPVGQTPFGGFGRLNCMCLYLACLGWPLAWLGSKYGWCASRSLQNCSRQAVVATCSPCGYKMMQSFAV